MKNPKKLEDYRHELETRIADLDRSIRATERDARALGSETADVIDQASSEYEKQVALHKASTDRQLRKSLLQALERIRQGTFGECAKCGEEIEPKRLKALPWARYCVKCQEEFERK